jgi:surfeit locus 1 family protein
VMLGVLLSLGTWQSRRYLERSRLAADYARQHDELPPLTALSGGLDAPDRLTRLHFRRASLQGKVDASHVQLLTARYQFGQRGWGVLAPLEVATGPHPKLLVHLGWVPLDQLDSYLARLRDVPLVQVRGRLRRVDDLPPGQQPVSVHEGRAVWRFADPQAVAKTVAGLDPQLLLDAGEQASGQAVDPRRIPLDGYAYPIHPLPSKHVEYAATWYGLAITLVAVWVALSRRAVDQAPA